MSEVATTIGLVIAAVLQLLLIFFIVRIVLKVFLEPLTAHYVSIAIVLSIFLGFLLSSAFSRLGLTYEVKNPANVLISWIVFSLISLNFFATPLLYGWDKNLSKGNTENQHRIPENAFHILVFLGGILGSKICQIVFNHKVSKKSFQNKHRLVLVTSMVLYGLVAYAVLN